MARLGVTFFFKIEVHQKLLLLSKLSIICIGMLRSIVTWRRKNSPLQHEGGTWEKFAHFLRTARLGVTFPTKRVLYLREPLLVTSLLHVRISLSLYDIFYPNFHPESSVCRGVRASWSQGGGRAFRLLFSAKWKQRSRAFFLSYHVVCSCVVSEKLRRQFSVFSCPFVQVVCTFRGVCGNAVEETKKDK